MDKRPCWCSKTINAHKRKQTSKVISSYNSWNTWKKSRIQLELEKTSQIDLTKKSFKFQRTFFCVCDVIAWSESGMENRHKINLSSFEWDAEFYDKAVIICAQNSFLRWHSVLNDQKISTESEGENNTMSTTMLKIHHKCLIWIFTPKMIIFCLMSILPIMKKISLFLMA